MRRPADVVARYGGDEFVLLLAGTDAPGAERVLENVRKEVQALHITDLTLQPVTISVGIAACTAQHSSMSPDDLLRRADRELYQAKQSGRNQISAEAAVA